MGDVVKTVALLPTPGDTFITRYWCRNYERVWRGEVDELLVFANGATSDALQALRDVGATIISTPERIGHGEALGRLVRATDADVVVLIEDDAYVRERGAIREHLSRAGEGEILGSPRGGMHPLLEEAALAKWGRVVSPDTSEGHGLWPCFLFVRTDILRATTCEFSARFWFAPDRVPGLGYRVDGIPVDTDTMTAVAFQLRDKHPITPVGQWKELWQKMLPLGGVPWFHAGGLSNLDQPIPEGKAGSNEGRDYAHRIWWWQRTGDAQRRDRMWKIAARAGLVNDLLAWDNLLPAWISWNDQP